MNLKINANIYQYIEYRHVFYRSYMYLATTVYILRPKMLSVHCHNSMNTAPVDSVPWLAADRIHTLVSSFAITCSCLPMTCKWLLQK